MKRLLLIFGLLIFYNSYAQPQNQLREKLYGVWSLDCANPQQARFIRTASTIGGDKYEAKDANGKIIAMGTYKVESITATKFKLQASIKSNLNQEIYTSNSIAEFFENGMFNKYLTLSSHTTNVKGETFTIERRGSIVYRKTYTEDEAKPYDGNLTTEKCLN
jgi:hypothetical protein